MKKKQTQKPTLRERIGWYPVSTVGWFLTVTYVLLLIYALVKTVIELNSANEILFRTAVLISWLVILVMIWARFTNEKLFSQKR